MDSEFNPQLHVNCNILISGASQSGKTHLVSEMLLQRDRLFTKRFTRIVWCYGEFQPSYVRLQAQIPEISWHEGVPKDLYQTFNPSDTNLLVVDDCMGSEDDVIAKLFTKGSHHRSLTVIFLIQNLFFKSKQSRTISLNSHYFIIFKNPRDSSQIGHLARQVYPTNPKFLTEVYEECTKQPHTYILLDLHQQTPSSYRVRSNILPNEQQYVYVPK
jgi:hypothetical protein